MMFVLSLLICGLVLALIRFSARRWSLEAEVQRKLAHVALGAYCLSLPWIFTDAREVALLCGVIVVLLLALRATQKFSTGWHAILYSVARTSYGEILFSVSVASLFALAMPRLELYVLPLAILTLADAAAAVVGVRYGKILYPVDDHTKSWEGSTTFFLVAWLVSLIIVVLINPATGWAPILMTLIIAVFATLIEAVSWRGLDNLLVPFGVFILIDKLSNAAVPTLFTYAGLLLSMLLITRFAAQKTGLHRTILWTAGLALLFVLIDGSWSNTLLPTVFAILIFAPKDGAAFKPRPTSVYLGELLTLIAPSLFCFMIYRVLDTNTSYLFNMIYLLQITALLSQARWVKSELACWVLVNLSVVALLGMRVYLMSLLAGNQSALFPVGVVAILATSSITVFYFRHKDVGPVPRMVGSTLLALAAYGAV